MIRRRSHQTSTSRCWHSYSVQHQIDTIHFIFLMYPFQHTNTPPKLHRTKLHPLNRGFMHNTHAAQLKWTKALTIPGAHERQWTKASGTLVSSLLYCGTGSLPLASIGNIALYQKFWALSISGSKNLRQSLSVMTFTSPLVSKSGDATQKCPFSHPTRSIWSCSWAQYLGMMLHFTTS